MLIRLMILVPLGMAAASFFLPRMFRRHAAAFPVAAALCGIAASRLYAVSAEPAGLFSDGPALALISAMAFVMLAVSAALIEYIRSCRIWTLQCSLMALLSAAVLFPDLKLFATLWLMYSLLSVSFAGRNKTRLRIKNEVLKMVLFLAAVICVGIGMKPESKYLPPTNDNFMGALGAVLLLVLVLYRLNYLFRPAGSLKKVDYLGVLTNTSERIMALVILQKLSMLWYRGSYLLPVYFGLASAFLLFASMRKIGSDRRLREQLRSYEMYWFGLILLMLAVRRELPPVLIAQVCAGFIAVFSFNDFILFKIEANAGGVANVNIGNLLKRHPVIGYFFISALALAAMIPPLGLQQQLIVALKNILFTEWGSAAAAVILIFVLAGWGRLMMSSLEMLSFVLFEDQENRTQNRKDPAVFTSWFVPVAYIAVYVMTSRFGFWDAGYFSGALSRGCDLTACFVVLFLVLSLLILYLLKVFSIRPVMSEFIVLDDKSRRQLRMCDEYILPEEDAARPVIERLYKSLRKILHAKKRKDGED